MTCNAISEGRNTLIEPTYFPIGTASTKTALASGQIVESGELVFKADWDTDKLIVEEEYYENRENVVAAVTHTFTLEKDNDGYFRLPCFPCSCKSVTMISIT